ncbi:lipopolysaccharide heptosyltransferase II [Magnetococcus marinus MC-1]|uniref:lipopolysaccharide heptosyltransferase II n=1 Tax=Magnetococcus marinus (strain ATCC BAA-1437 / JCM 17883 / MC-1) TaxID=156889 RepID=A0L7W8_MAGMM|nr:lipopolysaccharide heptosyltransferase II [Magnetococcus marinus]ABK44061.1 lipopolysaccharide heptosyltransferase II [Magnetococcus marinus MC-1]
MSISATESPILIIAPAWVGDMVMVSALTCHLQRQFPARPVDLLAPAWTLPIVRRLPHVRHALEMPLGHGAFAPRHRWRLGVALRDQSYGQAIILPRAWKSALLPYAARIPQRTGFLGELRYGLLNDIRPLNKALLPRTVDRFMALGTPAHQPFTPPALPQLALRYSAQAGLKVLARFTPEAPQQRPWVALCPGAEYGPAKQWPAHHFARTAQAILGEGYGVMLLGSRKDAALTAHICAQLPPSPHLLDLAGQTSLDEAVDLLAVAQTVITNDSGLMHVATAVERHVIALYGSSDPGHTPPLTEQADPLWLGLPCSPCFKRVCPEAHLNCLQQITPQQVLERWQAQRERLNHGR